jgi:hypothetical protein
VKNQVLVIREEQKMELLKYRWLVADNLTLWAWPVWREESGTDNLWQEKNRNWSFWWGKNRNWNLWQAESWGIEDDSLSSTCVTWRIRYRQLVTKEEQELKLVMREEQELMTTTKQEVGLEIGRGLVAWKITMWDWPVWRK